MESPPLGIVLNPLPSPTRVRFSPCSRPTPPFAPQQHWECPSICPPQPSSCKLGEEGQLLPSARHLAQSWWRGPAHPISWLSTRASRFVLRHFLAFTLGLNVLFLVLRGDREAPQPFPLRGGRIRPHLLQRAQHTQTHIGGSTLISSMCELKKTTKTRASWQKYQLSCFPLAMPRASYLPRGS